MSEYNNTMNGRDAINAMCEALGIDHKGIQSMTVHADINDIATVNLTMEAQVKEVKVQGPLSDDDYKDLMDTVKGVVSSLSVGKVTIKSEGK